LRKIVENYKNIVFLGVLALFVGVVIGAIDTLFGRVLIEITQFRTQHFQWLIPFLPFAGMLIIAIYRNIGKDSLKGMSLLFSAGFDESASIPKRLVPLVILSTWITHLFGGSAGREGVAVQIGGTVAYTIGRKIKGQNSARIMLITGMAAGFAGLFQTPIAATFFAMEVMTAGVIEYYALFPCLIAAFTASYTSHLLGLERFHILLELPLQPNASLIGKVLLLGILFGILGGLFAHALHYCKSFYSKYLKNPILRIFILGIILSICLLFLHQGRYSGLGTNLISSSFSEEKIYGYDWLLKFLFTIVTLSAGFQGGEVTPLFSIGSCFGIAAAYLLGLPPKFAAALGYAAVFGSATNTILAPIFIGVEVFGFEYLPYFFAVSAIAYVFNGNKSIYK
jgi:H+/Cl- antiporter ClcA